ncbi:uncharacterized protein PAC_05612 [Phialocephala subalpina]|uniref:Uncharacterized protein n=1 Tax=Phialocephala subalpina TaxID=576137 RepID=A0A1L7WSH8_9HELO|nr:uncharacterized protein PAC_05612 [Phialocephala subalpina]
MATSFAPPLNPLATSFAPPLNPLATSFAPPPNPLADGAAGAADTRNGIAGSTPPTPRNFSHVTLIKGGTGRLDLALVNLDEDEAHPVDNAADLREWNSLRTGAKSLQNRQRQEWRELCANHLKKYPVEKFDEKGTVKPDPKRKNGRKFAISPNDFSPFPKVMEAYGLWYQSAEKLRKINQEIQSFNKQRGRSESWGLVVTEQRRRPILQNEVHYELIEEDAELCQDLDRFFSKGYAIQLYSGTRNIHSESFVDFEESIVPSIGEINQSIEALGFSKVHSIEEFAWLDPNEVIDEDEDESELPPEENDQVHIEDEDQRLGINKSTQRVVDDTIVNLWSQLGGYTGHLSTFIQMRRVAEAKNSTCDPEYWQPIEDVNTQLTKYAQSKNWNPLDFVVNKGQIEAFSKVWEEASALFETIVEGGSDDDQLLIKYKDFDTNVRDFVKEAQFPENFVDAFVPSFDVINGERQSRKEKKLEGRLRTEYSSLLGPDGPLSRMLHGILKKKPDSDAEAAVEKIENSMLEQCKANGIDKVPDTYSIGHVLEVIREDARRLIELEDECVESGGHPTKRALLQNACSEISQSYDEDLRAVIIGDILTSSRYMGINRTSRAPSVESQARQTRPRPKRGRKTKHSTPSQVPGRVEAPRSEIEEGESMPTGAKPGVIVDIVDGVEVEKRIVYLRSLGKGFNGNGAWQLLVKWKRLGFKKPTYELIAAHKFRSAREEFQAAGGQILQLGKKGDLAGRPWSKIWIGGFASVERSEDDTYLNHAVTLVLLTNVGGKNGTWFSVTTLNDKYGDRQVARMHTSFMRESGQTPSKAPVSKNLLRDLMRIENHIRARRGETSIANMTDRQEKGKLMKRLGREAEEWTRERIVSEDGSDDGSDDESDDESNDESDAESSEAEMDDDGEQENESELEEEEDDNEGGQSEREDEEARMEYNAYRQKDSYARKRSKKRGSKSSLGKGTGNGNIKSRRNYEEPRRDEGTRKSRSHGQRLKGQKKRGGGMTLEQFEAAKKLTYDQAIREGLVAPVRRY